MKSIHVSAGTPKFIRKYKIRICIVHFVWITEPAILIFLAPIAYPFGMMAFHAFDVGGQDYEVSRESSLTWVKSDNSSAHQRP